MTETRYEALFASALQPSDSPTASMTAEAISSAIRKFGVRGCAGRMAQEFGDHPDAAASRMRWVLLLAQMTPDGASAPETSRTRWWLKWSRDPHRPGRLLIHSLVPEPGN